MSALDLMARRLDDYMWREHGVCIGKAATVAALDNIALPALLAKSAAYDALVAEIARAPVVTAGSWIRNYMASANRIEYGSRVRLLLVREGVDGS